MLDNIYISGEYVVSEHTQEDGTTYFVYTHVNSGAIQYLYVAQDLVSDIRNMLQAGVS